MQNNNVIKTLSDLILHVESMTLALKACILIHYGGMRAKIKNSQ